MSRKLQNKYYLIESIYTGKKDYVESLKPLVIGRVYTNSKGESYRIIRKVHFKYSYSDINNIITLMDGYSRGTVQYNLLNKAVRASKNKVPAIRFTEEEREVLYFIYSNSGDISDSELDTLRRVLNI